MAHSLAETIGGGMIELKMQKSKLSKIALAQKMQTSRSALDSLPDPGHVSAALQPLKRAAPTLGKRGLYVFLVNILELFFK